MGSAVRNRDGRLELLSGNQVGALLADYRLTKFKEMGWIPPGGSDSACLIKTFVTTRLQDAIGHGHGVKVINTLTGFKWIAAKLRGYEERLRSVLGPAYAYDAAPLAERARLLLKHSTFFTFGTEESYGYLPNDLVRDKDGNAACLMFAELCAWVKGRGLTVPEYLDQIFVRYGFYLEGVINLYYEGASGSAQIKRILDSYRLRPPEAFGELPVAQFQDFGREEILDEDEERDPQAGSLHRHARKRHQLRRAGQRDGAEDEVLPVCERQGRLRRGAAGGEGPGEGGARSPQAADRGGRPGPG